MRVPTATNASNANKAALPTITTTNAHNQSIIVPFSLFSVRSQQSAVIEESDDQVREMVQRSGQWLATLYFPSAPAYRRQHAFVY
jgi:hypothetical protein